MKKKVQKKRNWVILGGLILAIAIYYYTSVQTDTTNSVFTEVRRADLIISVEVSGEIEAKRSVKVIGPNLRKVGVWESTIDDIVDEGTIVKKGDYIASINSDDLGARLEDQEERAENLRSDLELLLLDTFSTQEERRNGIENDQFMLQEKKNELEMAIYEPPAKKRQLEAQYEQQKRKCKQAEQNYDILLRRNQRKVQHARNNLKKTEDWISMAREVMQECKRVVAPQNGMVVYTKYRGDKNVKGSRFRTWEPNVAELPDLSDLIAKTFVNEVDIRQVAKGQQVTVGFDAFPDKTTTGEVTAVANIGQSMKGSDAKVFEVVVDIEAEDDDMKPGMTTSNDIIINSFEDVLLVPLEAIHKEDSTFFVYQKKDFGYVKQEVLPGESNDNEIMITDGVEEGDVLYFSLPDEADGKEIQRLD